MFICRESDHDSVLVVYLADALEVVEDVVQVVHVVDHLHEGPRHARHVLLQRVVWKQAINLIGEWTSASNRFSFVDRKAIAPDSNRLIIQLTCVAFSRVITHSRLFFIKFNASTSTVEVFHHSFQGLTYYVPCSE